MTRAELASLGLDDRILAKSFREEFGETAPLMAGDGPTATARRREVFDALSVRWYAPEETRKG